MNSDLNPGDGEENASVATQFARFVRRVPHLRADLPLDDARRGHRRRDRRRRHRPRARSPIGDVRAAWRNYLATRNQGRPFVLIGHSQGSLMLIQLLATRDRGPPRGRSG